MADEIYAPIEEYVNLIEGNMERLRQHFQQLRDRRSTASTRTSSPALSGKTALSALPTSEAGTAASSGARSRKRPPAKKDASSSKREQTSSPPPKRRDSSGSSRASLGSSANLHLDAKLSLAESPAVRHFQPIVEDSDEEMPSPPRSSASAGRTPRVDLHRMTDAEFRRVLEVTPSTSRKASPKRATSSRRDTSGKRSTSKKTEDLPSGKVDSSQDPPAETATPSQGKPRKSKTKKKARKPAGKKATSWSAKGPSRK